MRMWMVDPKIMCRKHLCGEHVEHHMFIGTIKKGTKVDGYLRNNLLEPLSIFQRHQELSNEMLRRGYNHNSPLEECDCECICNLLEHQRYYHINRESALNDLISRCPECRQNYKRRTSESRI